MKLLIEPFLSRLVLDPNQFAAYAVDGYLRSNLEEQKSNYDKILKEKKESMEKGLEEVFSGTNAKWSSPQEDVTPGSK